jgi:osmotically-inducible protein OsmY
MHLDDVAVAAVLVELKWEPTLDASRIRVVATDGVAFLHGKVSTYAEKLAASRAALRASGIRFVHNAIEVDLCGADRMTDDDLRLAALQALEREAYVPDGLVDVQVSDGIVTLRASSRAHSRSTPPKPRSAGSPASSGCTASSSSAGRFFRAP